MIKKSTLFIAFISMATFGQKSPKVDLDRFSVVAEYQKLPELNIPFQDRVYNVNTEVSPGIYNMPDAQNITNDILIHGWKFSNESPSVSIFIRIEDFIENNVAITHRLVEEKDKDGKVIKSYKLYKAKSSFNGKAAIDVTTTFTITQEKPIDKKVEENRFLSPTTSKTTTGEASFRANQSLSHETKEFRTFQEAEKEYKLNRSNTYKNQLNTFISHVKYTVNNHVNAKFGFKPSGARFILWILDSKEEEGQIQKDAIEAVRIIFSEMKATTPIAETEERLQPLIAYFESLKTKYPNDDKGSKKIRYSAYFNLGKIYYFLDQPEKAIKEGQGLIENGYDKKDGEEIIKDAEELMEEFKEKGFASRHNASLN